MRICKYTYTPLVISEEGEEEEEETNCAVLECWRDRREGKDAKHLSEAGRVHFINNTLPW